MRPSTFILALGAFLLAVWPAPAADMTQTVTASAAVGALAKLALTPATLFFQDADPETVPFIPSATGPITITAKARTTMGTQVTLTMLAADDLRSGMDTIPIDALRWTATGPGFVPGVASKTVSQPVATWDRSGNRIGTQSFALANGWQRPTGTYTVTLVYTLTAP
jgi:hypothetical protein